MPAAHYCCDGLTRPVLLTVDASCVAVRAFFRKLTGDSRVVAVFESTIARPFTAIPGARRFPGRNWFSRSDSTVGSDTA